MARCGCGGSCNCRVTAGPGVTVDGNGSSSSPYVISGDVSCDDVRPCLSAGPGVDYDPTTGVISADLSDDAGNNITTGTDGGLFVPSGSATVSTGCGLTGDGSASAPVTAAVGAWPYPCDVTANGGVVACDANGVLRGEPRGQANYYSYFEQRNYPDIPVPAPQNTVVDSFTFDVTNPDPCREALVVIVRELDCYMDLPPGANGAFGFTNDETFNMRNTGTSTIVDFHAQACKVIAPNNGVPRLAPGATMTVTVEATAGRGSGGASINQIQWFCRAMLFSL